MVGDQRGKRSLADNVTRQRDRRPCDAVLWGFGRSLANEAVGHSVYLLDIPAAVSEPALHAWATLLTQPDSENEALIDNQGHRFATRLRTLPAPHPAAEEQTNEQTKQPHQAMSLALPCPASCAN